MMSADAGGPRWLVFRVRELRCALPLADVVETMRPLPIEALSGAPRAVLGLSIIRGEPLPVVDVAALLGAGDARDVRRFVTVRTGARKVALAVDEVLGVREGETAVRELPPLFGEAEPVAAIGALDAELLVVLRGARLLPQVAT